MKRIISLTILVTIVSVGMLYAREDWQSVTAAGVTFEFRVTQDELHLEGIMSAQTTGWVSVGFNPVFMMNEANIIIGYVDDGVGFIRDDWGTGPTSHDSDVSLGGTDDVTLVEAHQIDGVTTIHFIIPLDSGDQFDQPLSIGETYPVCIARGPNGANNFTTTHAAAAMAEITLVEPTSVEEGTIVKVPTDAILSIQPNPFRNRTQVKYRLQESSRVQISFYNLKGQLVHREVRDEQKGEHILNWQAKDLPSGIYLMQLTTDRGSDSQRITIIKR